MKKALLLALAGWMAATTAAAQTKIGLLAGGGASFLTGKRGSDTYSASYGLAGVLQLRKAVTERVWIESGAGFQLRRFGLQSVVFSDSLGEFRTEERRRYHYVTVPLQLSYKAMDRGGHQLFAGLGASYGFLVAPRVDLTNTYTNRSGFTEKSGYTNGRLPAGLFQSDTEPIAVYSFLMSVQAHVTFYWRGRYAIRAFYDYGLYDVNAAPKNGSRMHLHLAGLQIGYTR